VELIILAQFIDLMTVVCDTEFRGRLAYREERVTGFFRKFSLVNASAHLQATPGRADDERR
jgi:hypothetical protein